MVITRPYRDVDPKLLRTFLQIAEDGSFAKAASALNLSQPAVSAQVRKLERLLGARLFQRTSGQRNVNVTAFAKRLLPHAHEILRLNHAVFSNFMRKEVTGSVRLAATEDHAAHLLPAIVGAFRRAYPCVEVEIETGMTIEMREHVGSRYDLVLAAQPAGTKRGQVLRREQLHWTRSSHHRVDLEDPLPLAVYPDGCSYRRWAEKALTSVGRSWRIAVTSPSRSTIEATVLQGLAVSVLPASSIKDPLVKLGESDQLPRLPDLELALYRRKAKEGAAQQALANAIISALSG